MAMIEIRAVVRPSRVEMLRAALRQLPEFPGMTVAKVEGCSGTGKLGNYPWSIKQDLVDFTPKSWSILSWTKPMPSRSMTPFATPRAPHGRVMG